MIDFANKYKDQLSTLYKENVLGNDFYKYWNNCNYWKTEFPYASQEDEWNYIERVSVFDNKVYGYFK